MSQSNAPAKPSSNLGLRIAAGAVMTPIALGLIWLGSIWFILFAAVLGVFIAIEWCAIVHEGSNFQRAHHGFATSVAAFSPLIGNYGVVVIIIAIVWLATVIQAILSRRVGFWAVVGVPYVSVPIAALVVLRQDANAGFAAVLLLFAAVACADTLAFFVGRAVGGPRLWPSVSPNKTWSGFFGAITGATAASVLVFVVFGFDNLLAATALGAAIGAVEQGGDLFESAAKRKFDIKDSGAIIPGHGGVLDRLDGLMASAVMALTIGTVHTSLANAASGFVGW